MTSRVDLLEPRNPGAMSGSMDWHSLRPMVWMTSIPPTLGTWMQCNCMMLLATGSMMCLLQLPGAGGKASYPGAACTSWLLQLYPAGVEFDWRLSNYLFRLPSVEVKLFHAAPRRVLRWTRACPDRCFGHQCPAHDPALKFLPQFSCCPASTEDDVYVIAGCPGTRSDECTDLAFQLWLKMGAKGGLSMVSLPLHGFKCSCFRWGWIASLLIQSFCQNR